MASPFREVINRNNFGNSWQIFMKRYMNISMKVSQPLHFNIRDCHANV
jgi:hypothetical protein